VAGFRHNWKIAPSFEGMGRQGQKFIKKYRKFKDIFRTEDHD